MKNFRRKIALVSAFVLAASLSLSACGSSDTGEDKDGSSTSTNSAVTDVTITGNSGSNTAASEHSDAGSFTLMVYFCGSDLESDYGCATSDINEILYGEPGDGLNVIIQTGGTTEWQNSVISADSVQRYSATGEGLTLIDDIGQQQVTSTDVLADFISFAKDYAPADRYGFIFWDHGGGTLCGYGSDTNYDEAGMSIYDIVQGFDAAGLSFDFIGFDCCLMSTIEDAQALTPYASYMIASEETEPGTGWYYTNFINQLNNDPGASVYDIASTIINDYLDADVSYIDNGVTLSLIDLSQLSNVLDNFNTYLSNSSDALRSGEFAKLSTARSGARSYGHDGYDQIDIIDYVTRTDIEGADELLSALKSAILINGTNISGSNGLAMYYPYTMPEYYDAMSSYYEVLNFDTDKYASYFNDFLTVMAGGQASGGSSNPYSNEETTETQTYEDCDWYDTDLAAEYEDTYDYVSSDELVITEKGDGYVLQLSDDDWSLITQIALQVYADDGEGFLELGSDNCYDFDEDGDLIIDYDYTWIYLNDSIVAYYVEEIGEYTDGTTYSVGYVPAVLNDETDIDIWLLWDNETAEAEVLGYIPESDGPSVSAKGYSSFEDGDVIDFYFDYYTYDGEYDASYLLADNSLTYSSDQGIEVAYGDIGEIDTQICFYLEDVYGNSYWTEPLALIVG